MTPTRLLVMQRLCALLEETPLVVNGKSTDLTGAVVRGRNIIGEEQKPLPMLSILEAPRPDVASFAGEEGFMRHDKWTLLIQGRALDDKLNPSDNAYWLEAAVEERLSQIMATKRSGSPEFPAVYMLGGLITTFEIAPPVVRPPDDKVSAAAYFFLPIRVGIAVNVGSPYTSGS